MDVELIDGMYLICSTMADLAKFELPEDAFHAEGLHIAVQDDFAAVFIAKNDEDRITLEIMRWHGSRDLDGPVWR